MLYACSLECDECLNAYLHYSWYNSSSQKRPGGRRCRSNFSISPPSLGASIGGSVGIPQESRLPTSGNGPDEISFPTR